MLQACPIFDFAELTLLTLQGTQRATSSWLGVHKYWTVKRLFEKLSSPQQV